MSANDVFDGNSSMRYSNVENRNVIVTGCSSGIGQATAEHLRSRGWRGFPSARKTEDLERLQASGFECIAMEMAESDSVKAGFKRAMQMCSGQIGALVNNAGYGQPGALEDLSREDLRRQFEVNVFGMQELTNLCIPAFRAFGAGRIVNISSVLGRVTMPFLGAYSASKHAMESFSDALRVELRGSGIAVSVVEPGPINTEFGNNSHSKLRDMELLNSRFWAQYEVQGRRFEERRTRDDRFMLPPESVARKIALALESARPARRYKVTIPAYVGAVMRRIAPDSLIDGLFARLWEKRTEK